MLAAGCAVFGPGDNPAPPALPQAIARTGELRVGLIPGRPPYLEVNPADDTGFSGLELKLLKALATTAGLPLRLRSYDTEPELFAALRMGEIDLAVPAASDWTVLRHYHRPCALHQTTGQRCVVRREAGAFLTDPGQLNQSGIITVTVAGTAGAELARTWLPRARHESFPALPQALARLRATDGAVLLTDARQAWELARANADLALVFPIQGVESLAWAVRDDPDGQGWAAYLDYFLAEAQADGRLARWLSETGADLVTSSPGTAPAASPAGN